MKDPITGLTGAQHAELTGPDWYAEAEETEEATPDTPKEVNTMYGKEPICTVCVFQLRPVDNPTDTDCTSASAQFNSRLCSAYEAVSHEQLAERVAEMDAMLTIAWDVVMILLDHAEALPEVQP